MSGAPGPRTRGETIRIGLTGPIGCGKSTVAGWLAERGAVVIDADKVARDVTQPGEPAYESVIEEFGERVRAADGTLDREALAGIVFADQARLRALELIVHPAVRPRILALLGDAAASGAPVVVLEAIKLVEGGLADLCDEVWLVTCDPETQRERLIGRGVTRSDAETRMRAQGNIRERLAPPASRRIDTTGSPEVVRPRVDEALRASLAALARRA